MGSGPKPVEGVKLREAAGRHEGASGAHGAAPHGTAHAGGHEAVPRNQYDSTTSPFGNTMPVSGFSGRAREAAGGQRAASSSAAAPHETGPSGRNQYDNLHGVELLPPGGGHYTAPPAGGAAGQAAGGGQHYTPGPSQAATAPGGHQQYTPAPSQAAAAPAHGQSNYIEMQVLPAHSASSQPAYNQTSLVNGLGQGGTGAGATGQPIYHAPPVTGPAAGGVQAGGGAGAPGGGGGAPGGGHQNNAVQPQHGQQNQQGQQGNVQQGDQATRFQRFKEAVKRNPKRSVVITVAGVVVTATAITLGILRPWVPKDDSPMETPPVDNTAPPKPTVKPGSRKLTNGANLTGESLIGLAEPGSNAAAYYAINPASFILYANEDSAEGGASVETVDGNWEVSTAGALSFVPKAAFSGGAASIHFSVSDLKGTGSNRAKFTVQYGPMLHDGSLTDQDPKARAVTYTVANRDVVAMTGAFEAHGSDPENALDPASILFFNVTTNADKETLQVDGAGTWSATNGVITFTPVSGFMAQMVFVTYSVKDKAGAVSNRAVLTLSFKPEGMVVDPGNKDMTRVPVISFNMQVAVSGKTVSAPVSSDINLTADSLRIVSGAARVASLSITGQGRWEAANNVLTFTPEAEFRNAPPPVQVTARSAFGVESAPVTLALKIFALPIMTDDYVSSSYPAIVRPLSNDRVGYTMEGNALVPGSVEIFAVISAAAGPVVAANRKSASVPGEGSWTVNADGSITFAPVAGFAGGPKPISYTVADLKGSRSDPAVITLNRQVGDIATRLSAMISMSQTEFFQNYVMALSDPSKKYSMFDVLDATNQLMLMFTTEARRLGQFVPVQNARAVYKPLLDTETNDAMSEWMNLGFTIQGLVNATTQFQAGLIGLAQGSNGIGIRAFRLEIMATLVERYISLSMMVRGKAMQ